MAKCPTCHAAWAPDHQFCPKDGTRLVADDDGQPPPLQQQGLGLVLRDMPVVGEILGDKYKLERVIGAGGSGVVFEARHLRIDRSIAIKVLRPEVVGDETQLARFAEEARLAGRIDHEGIVEIMDLVMDENAPPYLVMELLEGVSLSAHLQEQGQIPPDRAIEIAMGVLEALTAAHRRDIIHRDVKPGNIFISQKEGRGEVIKLLDFGIARALSENLRLTAPGRAVGTAIFMAPEQLMATEIDQRADIYSVAAVLYLMLTGEQPFEGRSWAELARSKLVSSVKPLRGFATPLGLRLEQVIKHGLEINREDRPDSAEAFARELAQTHDVITALGQHRPMDLVETHQQSDSRKVAVIPFSVSPGSHLEAWAGEALALSLFDDLAARRVQRLVSKTMVDAAIRGAAAEGHVDPSAIGHQVGATYALTGTLDLSGPEPRVETIVIEVESGEIKTKRTQTGELQEIFRLNVATLDNLGSAFKLAPPTERRQPALAETDYDAFKDYAHLTAEATWLGESLAQDHLLGKIDALISRFPRHTGLRRLRATTLLQNSEQGGGNLENDLPRIHADLELLATWGSSNPWVVVGRARIRHAAQFFSPREALALTEERRAVHGLDAKILLEQATALENLGLVDEAMETLSMTVGHDQTCGPGYLRLATLTLSTRETTGHASGRALDRAAYLIRSANRLRGEEQVEGHCSTSSRHGWPPLPGLWPLDALLHFRRGDRKRARSSIDKAHESVEEADFFTFAAVRSLECLLDDSCSQDVMLELIHQTSARLDRTINHEICEIACALPEVWLPALKVWLDEHANHERLALLQAIVTARSGDSEHAINLARVLSTTATSEAIKDVAKHLADRMENRQ